MQAGRVFLAPKQARQHGKQAGGDDGDDAGEQIEHAQDGQLCTRLGRHVGARADWCRVLLHGGFLSFFFFCNKLTLAFNVGAQTTAGVIIPATSGDPSQLVSHVCGQWDIVSAARAALTLVKTTAKEFTFDDGATKSMHTSFCASDAASWVVPRLRVGNRSAPQERPHKRDAKRTG